MKYMLSVFCALIFSLPLYGQWQLNGVAVCDTVDRQHIAASGIIREVRKTLLLK